MSSRRIAVGSAVLTICLFLVNGHLAHSEPNSGASITSPKGNHRPPGSIEKEDLEITARNKGISAEAANQRYGWQEEFTRIVAVLAQNYPDQYADSAMPAEPSMLPEVSFVGDPPEEAFLLLQKLPVPVRIVGNAEKSAKQLRDEVFDLAQIAGKTFGSRVKVEPDEARTGFVVTTDMSAVSSLDDSAEVVLRRAVMAKGRPADRIKVKVIEELTGERSVVVYGGGALSTCTSGFTVRRTSGTQKGIITADHCTDSQNYEGKPVLTWRSRLATSQGDIQYMSSSDSVGYSFYNDRGRLSPQDAMGTPSRNMPICWFGKTTNVKKCTQVNNYPIAVGSSSGGYGNMVDTENCCNKPGDSGGPWSYGTTVYGVTHGYYAARDVFTPLYNTLSQLGLRINY